MDDHVRIRLESILKRTEAAKALKGGAFWVEDKAGARSVLDDLSAGRLAFHSARSEAQAGLDALAAGDESTATMCAWTATDFYMTALETQLARTRPSETGSLSSPAGRRGRPKKEENIK